MTKAKKPHIPHKKELFLGTKDKELEKFDLIEVQKTSWNNFINIE